MSIYTDASLIITPNAKKAGKLYSLKGADLDVVRATTATYVGSDGLIKTALANVPRLDYTNGSCPSILVEPQRTNLLLRSEEFDNAYWTKSNVSVTSNTTTSPSGVTDADTFTANGTSNQHYTVGTALGNLTSGVVYTLSVYMKKGTNNFAQLWLINTIGGMFANFDLNNGVVGSLGTVTGTPPTSSIQSVGNGWYRCIMTFTPTTTATIGPIIGIITSSTAPRGEINTLSTSVFLWGAQLEQGSNATSYIPTVASSVTRNADVISKSGISSLIGQTDGTLFLDASSFNFLGTGVGERISFTDGTFNNRVSIDLQSTTAVSLIAFNSTLGLTGTITSTNGLISTNNRFKIAIAYNGINSVLYINGVSFTNIIGTIPTFSGQLNTIEFNQGNGGRPFFGRVNNLIVYPNRLSNSQLQQLTTL